MVSVADLVEPDTVSARTRPANLRLGRQIVAEGGVSFVEFGPLRVTAKVGGTPASPTRRTVELLSVDGELAWSCTCTKSRARLCKHTVAAAIVTWEEAPKRRV